uniref:Uncharacterized protein n=1 Tax=Romanomermis culicivorax TaxID=13658 RepID=A0A915JTN0_ROMCU
MPKSVFILKCTIFLLFFCSSLYLRNYIAFYERAKFSFKKEIFCPKNNQSFSNDDYSKNDLENECEYLWRGNRSAICRWINYHGKINSSHKDETWAENLKDCDQWIKARGYPLEANSAEEADFPIAYSISLYKDVDQVERLLRLIYWPQNLYCFHVDAKSPDYLHLAIQRLSRCFANVFVTKSEYVFWSHYSVLRASLNCLNDSATKYANHSWKFIINLSGQDFPLKTNREFVAILKTFNNTNDVELAQENQFSRYWYEHRLIFDKYGNLITHKPIFELFKLPIPYDLKILKGNLAASLSRKFVEFMLNNAVSLAFIKWLEGTDTADEHLWATLNYNVIRGYGIAPGGFDQRCVNFSKLVHQRFVSRYVKWRDGNVQCHGKYVRDVCIFGVGDLANLISSDKTQFFANKFYTNYQTMAFYCMEKWMLNKIRRNATIDSERLIKTDGLYFNGKICM